MKKTKILPYIITLAVGLVVAVGIFLLQFLLGNKENRSASYVLGLLSDGFFVTGVVILCVGGLSFVKNQGTFDGLGYAVQSFLTVRNWSKKHTFKERESYGDYRERKIEERKEKKSISHYVITSIVLVVIAVIFLVISKNV